MCRNLHFYIEDNHVWPQCALNASSNCIWDHRVEGCVQQVFIQTDSLQVTTGQVCGGSFFTQRLPSLFIRATKFNTMNVIISTDAKIYILQPGFPSTCFGFCLFFFLNKKELMHLMGDENTFFKDILNIENIKVTWMIICFCSERRRRRSYLLSDIWA